MIKTFKDLEIWKKGIELVREIYSLTAKFPQHELYGLISQMRRAAVSIPSNVAEGFRRRGPREFKQFLNIALGSLAELETHVVISEQLQYLDGKEAVALNERLDHLSRMTANLLKCM